MTTNRRSFLRTAALMGLGALSVDLLAACRPAAPSWRLRDGPQSRGTAGGAQAPVFNTYALKGTGSGGVLRIGMSATNVPIPDTPPTEGGEGRAVRWHSDLRGS